MTHISSACLLALACTFIVPSASLSAAGVEYFVSTQGDDTNDGRSMQTAFATVQKGVDALQAGDTLTILPGEYLGGAMRTDLGNMEVDTIIRAAVPGPPGTVLLRGDVPAPRFAPVPGYRFVHVADFGQPVQAALERDTLTIMPAAATMAELEFTPGMCHYDAEAKKLYISTSDFKQPDQHHYSVAVVEGHGLLVQRAQRVVVDGIAATGFNNATILTHFPHSFTRWGIMLAPARQCVIRRSVAYLNGSGIGIYSSGPGLDEAGWNLIEHCTGFANSNRYNSEGGNIIVFNGNHDQVRDSYAYLGGDSGFRFYGASNRGPSLMKRNIAWGGSYTDFFLKGGKIEQFGVTENCIGLGIFHSHNVKHCLIGTLNQYNRDPGDDNIRYAAEAHDNRDREFADPDNLDFRLQSTSQFRGTASDGSDRGPFAYEANVFFIKPDGNDDANGLSVRNAWKTLTHALPKLRPGDTLYLEPGTYDAGSASSLSIKADGEKRTAIRGRGTGAVVIRGPLTVEGSAKIDLQRLTFTDTLTLRGGSDVQLHNCRHAAGDVAVDAADVRGLGIRQGEFTGFGKAALRLARCDDVWLSNNIFDHAKGQAVVLDGASSVLYSDHNAYRDVDASWSVAGQAAARPTAHDAHSRTVAADFAVEAGMVTLRNRFAFAGVAGPSGTPAGFYREREQREIQLVGPMLHSVTDTTANIEWRISHRADVTIAWGDTPDCRNVVKLKSEPFGTYSLTGLEPGRQYYFRIVSADEYVSMARPRRTLGIRPDGQPLSFQTESAARPAVVYHVSPAGDDANTGLSREQAFRTVNRAADAARAGDTVLIGQGKYVETVRIRATGDVGRPITFKAAPGERVDFDGQRRMITVAFAVNAKHHLRFDGLYFHQFNNGGWESVFNIFDSSHIHVTRSMMNGHGGGIAPQMIRTDRCSDILLKNCVIAAGFQGSYFTTTTNLTIENNLFLRNLICAILNSGGNDKGIVIRNNIFVDSIPSKVQAQLFELGGIEQYVFDNNCFYLRIPDAQRKMFLFYGHGPGRVSIEEYEKIAGSTNSIVADPQLVLTAGKEIKDRDGAPITFLGDWMVSQPGLDFPMLFTTHPDLIERGIGLQREAFRDFHFNEGTR